MKVAKNDKNTMCHCVVVRGNLNVFRYSNEILTPICISHLQNNGRIRLMHDGAPSHTARATRALLQANRINVLTWPPLLLDLNPIEHIWDVIGQRVRSGVSLNIRNLKRFVVEEWSGVAQLTFRNYIASMRSRCQAVVNANGAACPLTFLFKGTCTLRGWILGVRNFF